MDKYLITGGAGFIGFNFVKMISEYEKNSEIIILDKLTYASNFKNLEDVLKKDNIKFIKGDVSDSNLIEIVLREHKINKIINFAAESHVDKSLKNEIEFINTNIIGVQNLISVSRKIWNEFEMNDTLFLQISTDEVYGGIDKNTEALCTEETLLNPKNPYSASKASAEYFIEAYKNAYNYPAIIVRSTNNYGSYQDGEKFIPMIIKNSINKNTVTIYGDGLNKRCWLYVEDNCYAIYKILKIGKIGEAYNIKGNITLTNLELINIIENILKKFSVEVNREFVDDRLGHDYYYNVSDEKLKKMIGNYTRTSFKEGIVRTVRYYLENSKK